MQQPAVAIVAIAVAARAVAAVVVTTVMTAGVAVCAATAHAIPHLTETRFVGHVVVVVARGRRRRRRRRWLLVVVGQTARVRDALDEVLFAARVSRRRGHPGGHVIFRN